MLLEVAFAGAIGGCLWNITEAVKKYIRAIRQIENSYSAYDKKSHYMIVKSCGNDKFVVIYVNKDTEKIEIYKAYNEKTNKRYACWGDENVESYLNSLESIFKKDIIKFINMEKEGTIIEALVKNLVVE